MPGMNQSMWRWECSTTTHPIYIYIHHAWTWAFVRPGACENIVGNWVTYHGELGIGFLQCRSCGFWAFVFFFFFGNALGERMIVVNDNHGYWMALWWSNMAGWKISFEWMFIAVKIIGRIFQPAIFDYSQGRFWYSGEEKTMANVNGSLDFFGIWQFGWLLPWVLGW